MAPPTTSPPQKVNHSITEGPLPPITLMKTLNAKFDSQDKFGLNLTTNQTIKPSPTPSPSPSNRSHTEVYPNQPQQETAYGATDCDPRNEICSGGPIQYPGLSPARLLALISAIFVVLMVLGFYRGLRDKSITFLYPEQFLSTLVAP